MPKLKLTKEELEEIAEFSTNAIGIEERGWTYCANCDRFGGRLIYNGPGEAQSMVRDSLQATNAQLRTDLKLTLSHIAALESERLNWRTPPELPVGENARIIQCVLTSEIGNYRCHVHEARTFEPWMFEGSLGWIYESELIAELKKGTQ